MVEVVINGLRMRTLVLVDNNKDNFQFIIDALASIDSRVQCLSLVFPEEAIRGLRSQLIGRPDAILVNFSMPGKNGVEFILQLRSDSEWEHVPIILYADKSIRERRIWSRSHNHNRRGKY